MLRKLAVSFALAALVAAQPVWATTINLTANIVGSQQVPAEASLAFGTGVFTFDDVTNILTFKVLFTNAPCTPTSQGGCLDTPEIAAHIHGPARAGLNANILFPLPPGALKEGTIDITENAAALAADLLAGLWYVNIHTEEHQNGEIRGQILPVGAVPEPGSLALLLGAGAAMVRARRRG